MDPTAYENVMKKKSSCHPLSETLGAISGLNLESKYGLANSFLGCTQRKLIKISSDLWRPRLICLQAQSHILSTTKQIVCVVGESLDRVNPPLLHLTRSRRVTPWLVLWEVQVPQLDRKEWRDVTKDYSLSFLLYLLWTEDYDRRRKIFRKHRAWAIDWNSKPSIVNLWTYIRVCLQKRNVDSPLATGQFGYVCHLWRCLFQSGFPIASPLWSGQSEKPIHILCQCFNAPCRVREKATTLRYCGW